MADDHRKFVYDLPIVAKPPGVASKAVKFVQRHKSQALTLLAAVLLIPITLFTYQAIRQSPQEDTAASAEDPAAKREIELGIEGQEAGLLESAAQHYQAALEIQPKCYRALVNLAIIKKELYYVKGDEDLLADADRFLNTAIQERSKSPEPWNLRGIILREWKKLDEAENVLNDAIGIDGNYYALWVNLASVHALQGDLDKSESDLLHACTLPEADKAAMPYRHLAAVQFQLDRPGVMSTLDKVPIGEQDSVPFLLLRAKVMLSQHSFTEAKTALEDARRAVEKIDPAQPDGRAFRILALAEARLQHWDAARDAARKALQAGDSPASYAHFILALTDLHSAEFEPASQHYHEARQPEALPDELRTKDGFKVSVTKGILWFDNARELMELEGEVRKLLNPD